MTLTLLRRATLRGRRAWLVTLVALIIACSVGIAGCVGQVEAAPPEDLAEREQQAIRAALEKVAPSVLQVQTIGGSATGNTGLGQQTSSAVAISPDGFLVSSEFNFAQKPSAILVTLGDGTNLSARLVATDRNRGIVLLKIDLPSEVAPLSVAEIAPRDELRVGAWALAVGRIYEAKQPNVSVGIISALDRVWGKAVQTDAKVSPSNYGGPLVDIRGRVIGILAPLSPHADMGMSGTDWYDSGIGFAVPMADILAVVPRLRKGQDLHGGLLGISIEGRDLYSVPPKIAAVHPRGPADEAGLLADDLIVAVNGKSVENRAQLQHVVSPLYAGDEVTLAVMRDKKRVERSLQLAEELIPYAHPFIGILPVRDGHEDAAGAGVRYVYPDSPAAQAGLASGDRITEFQGTELTDVAALRQALRRYIPGEVVDLSFQRDGATKSAEITLAALPEDVPDDLPLVERPAGPVGKRPRTGAFDLKLPEFENECVVYVPKNYHPQMSHGVVIWLTAPGKFDKEALLNRWKEVCARRQLILLAPQPRDKERWAADELDFVRRTYDEVAKDYRIDASRVVAHGHEGGAAMAYLVAFSQRDVVRGVAAVQSPIPAVVRPPATDPARPLAIYVAISKQHEYASRVTDQIKALRKMKYPVTEVRFPEKPRYLLDSELAGLVQWIDGLDRL
ncbi:MAG: PDZ domain-containing protein [Planctomycetota bacterium]|nr:MAG: PDZ domain-containing protein [Planctomycetota bacterium]REK40835.1 MAG: PDZ domain-containing protein [Planctomycetota bacterium]